MNTLLSGNLLEATPPLPLPPTKIIPRPVNPLGLRGGIIAARVNPAVNFGPMAGAPFGGLWNLRKQPNSPKDFAIVNPSNREHILALTAHTNNIWQT